MDITQSQNFILLLKEICNLLYSKNYDKDRANILIDELIAKPYHSELFVRKNVCV